MSYAQAMKHSRNHRKDRFYQQCSFNTSGIQWKPAREPRVSAARLHRDRLALRRALARTAWTARREGYTNDAIRRFLNKH